MEKGYYKKSQYVHLWLHLLFKANHAESKFLLNKHEKILKRGQLLTGRKKLSTDTGICEGTIENILKTFENEQQILQQKTNLFRIITIVNYDEMQKLYNHSDNKVTTKLQQNDTYKSLKSLKEDKENIKESAFLNVPHSKEYQEVKTITERIVEYFNKKCNMKITAHHGMIKLIGLRLIEGHTEADFLKVIDNKSQDKFFKEKKFNPTTYFSEKNFDFYIEEQPENKEQPKEVKSEPKEKPEIRVRINPVQH